MTQWPYWNNLSPVHRKLLNYSTGEKL